MNSLDSSSSSRRLGRALTMAAVCALIACAALCLTLTMHAQQSGGPRAIVRRGLTVNGRIEGSVQQLAGENTTVNGGGVLTGDLLVPGTPAVRQNGHPAFGGTVQGTGGAQPSNYQVTLNGNAQLGRLVMRTDPAVMPTLEAPPPAAGTRDVTLSNAGQSAGDFSTVRDLTLNGNVGMVAAPPGTYRRFTANGGSGFTLGLAGSNQPAVYNLNSLTLNGSSRLEVVGPVVLTVASAVTLNAVMGASNHPEWLNLKVVAGGVTLNGGGTLYGVATAPTGTVTINGNASLIGGLMCDRLTINGNALLRLVDIIPPALAVTQPVEGAITNAARVTVTGSYSDESQTAITVNGVAATLTGNSFSASVPLVEGPNVLTIRAADSRGNETLLTRNVLRDSAPPVITINKLSENEITNASGVTVTGSYDDASVAEITVGGVRATLTGGNYTADVPLTEGRNTITVSATDAAGNNSVVSQTVTRDSSPPELVVQSPVNQSAIRQVLVSGRASDSNLTSAGVTVNGNPTRVAADGSFVGELVLPDGVQEIRITAVDGAGNLTEVVRTVTVDTTPPLIDDLAPGDNSIVDSPTTVRGRVTDQTPVSVSVNGAGAALGPDGLFTAAGITLAEGRNELAVRAVDAAGNESTSSLLLLGRDRTGPGTPVVFPINPTTRLALLNVGGRAEPGAQITITGGVEPVITQAAMGSGLFVTNVKLKPGGNNLGVTAADAEGNVSLAASVSVNSDPTMPSPPGGQPAQINISAGNTQKGLVGNELPRPLITLVTDQAGQPVPNAAVHFSVVAGGGRFVGGGDTIEVLTDAQGRASARYVSGAAGCQVVRASFAGNLLSPATFMAEALQSPAGGATSVSGIVLDQNLRALPNVIIRISGQQTRTGADGRFSVGNVAAGPHQLLEVIGRDQIPLPGRWPNITYDFDVLPGVDNNLGRPLFLPRVNGGVAMPLDANDVVTRDTVFELPVAAGEAPIRVRARAGTRVTFPPDVTDKRLSVTRIATNRVPMTLEDGRATNLYVSVQPSGAIFEQPLEISFPNLDRLPPGSETLLMSFDHDAGRYVSVGTGHVSADGRTVTSDPGVGIRVGAWHAFPPEPPQPEVTVLGYVQLKDNPAFEGKRIDSIEAWVEGTRAVLLDSLPAATSPPAPAGARTLSAAAAAEEAAEEAEPVGPDPVGPDRLHFSATLSLPGGTASLAAMESKASTTQSEVRLSPRKIYVEVGKKANLSAKLTPLPTKANAQFTHAWSSGDDNVARVDASARRPQYAATITGVNPGQTRVKISYTFPDGSTTEDDVTVTVIKLEVKRTGVNRVTAEADPPTSGSAQFDWESQQTNIANVDYEAATFAFSNPNSAIVTSSSATGLATIKVKFRFDLDAPTITKTVQVPVFQITCYVIAAESDYANNCTSVQNPNGLTGNYCQQFLMDVRLQGSGRDNSGNLIQIDFSQGNFRGSYATTFFHVVNDIRTASGRTLSSNSIAVDRNYISLGSSVEIDGLGVRSADDTGGAINGYHIDYFNGFGRAVCQGWANPNKLVKCDPATARCP